MSAQFGGDGGGGGSGGSSGGGGGGKVGGPAGNGGVKQPSSAPQPRHSERVHVHLLHHEAHPVRQAVSAGSHDSIADSDPSWKALGMEGVL